MFLGISKEHLKEQTQQDAVEALFPLPSSGCQDPPQDAGAPVASVRMEAVY